MSGLRVARLFGPGVLGDDPVLKLGARDHRHIEAERENDETADADNVGVRLLGRLCPTRNGWRVSFRPASAPSAQTTPSTLIAPGGTNQPELPPGIHVPPVIKFNKLNPVGGPSAGPSRAVLGPQPGLTWARRTEQRIRRPRPVCCSPAVMARGSSVACSFLRLARHGIVSIDVKGCPWQTLGGHCRPWGSARDWHDGWVGSYQTRGCG